MHVGHGGIKTAWVVCIRSMQGDCACGCSAGSMVSWNGMLVHVELFNMGGTLGTA